MVNYTGRAPRRLYRHVGLNLYDQPLSRGRISSAIGALFPPILLSKRLLLPKLLVDVSLCGACIASWRHVPAARFSRVDGYRFGAVDVVRPREWSDGRLQSVKRVGGLRTTKLDKAKPTARFAAHPQRGHKIRHSKQILL
ncbi:hypothetical protein ALC53_02642 [Atta colombica]|uniref:Uncharacterized protein n=1 Tax=Atta colombica TaxID=520822 RepID=A0A195BQM8_9HYME|nr:hypothetical protein ALC53_02642 [Atta colombica]